MPAITSKWVVVVSFMLLCWSCPPLEGARLHLLMVGDINPNEQILQNATERDLEAMRFEFQQIAHYAGLEFSETCFVGYSVAGKQILGVCQNLNVTHEDVVVFYFSGHGFTTPRQKNDPWPNLSFSGDRRGVPLSRVAKVIKGLNPRFALIFADCCNTVLSESSAPIVLKPVKGVSSQQLQRNYRKMFLESEGCVMLAGAKKAQPALATYTGSFCTRAFLKSLQEKLSGPERFVDWKEVLHATSRNLQLKAHEYSRKQDLIFLIE